MNNLWLKRDNAFIKQFDPETVKIGRKIYEGI